MSCPTTVGADEARLGSIALSTKHATARLIYPPGPSELRPPRVA